MKVTSISIKMTTVRDLMNKPSYTLVLARHHVSLISIIRRDSLRINGGCGLSFIQLEKRNSGR